MKPDVNPEDPRDAQKIVSEYAALLQQHANADVYPASVSALPYPKAVIQASVRMSVITLCSTGHMTDELRDFLEVAYVALADYLDDELVQLLVEYQEAAEQLANDHRLGTEKTDSEAWRILKQSSSLAGEIARQIADDARQLREEFQTFLS